MKEDTKENNNDLEDEHEMYSTWFGADVICFRLCCGAAKSVSQDLTKENRPMKLDLSWLALGLGTMNAASLVIKF